jgi:hypothetical protein
LEIEVSANELDGTTDLFKRTKGKQQASLGVCLGIGYMASK